MKRNYGSVKGAGWSRAFRDAAKRVDESPWEHAVRILSSMDTPQTKCDSSGDVGSTHLWPADAKVGDWCLCGKRKRFTPFPGE